MGSDDVGTFLIEDRSECVGRYCRWLSVSRPLKASQSMQGDGRGYGRTMKFIDQSKCCGVVHYDTMWTASKGTPRAEVLSVDTLQPTQIVNKL